MSGGGHGRERVGHPLRLGDHEVMAGVDVPEAARRAGLGDEAGVAGGEGGRADDVVLRDLGVPGQLR